MGPFMLFGRGQTEFASISGFPGDGRAACSEGVTLQPARSRDCTHLPEIFFLVKLVILSDATALSLLAL